MGNAHSNKFTSNRQPKVENSQGTINAGEEQRQEGQTINGPRKVAMHKLRVDEQWNKAEAIDALEHIEPDIEERPERHELQQNVAQVECQFNEEQIHRMQQREQRIDSDDGEEQRLLCSYTGSDA